MSKLINRNCPIGVFDSGLGGLTVVRELMRQLPHEDIVYFGDTARVPYGTKSKEAIIQFSHENTEVLLKYHVKAVVVACNSSSSYAISTLQRRFSVPVIGVIGPGAKRAVEMTRNRKVGVIATTATIKSQKYPLTVQEIDDSIRVFSQACPLFVPLVEEGWLNSEVTEKIAAQYLRDLKKVNIDTLILGCTHYPLLKKIIQKVMGNKVTLVDSAFTVTREVKDLLMEKGLYKTKTTKPNYQFLVSDKPQEFGRIAKKFLGRELVAKKIKV